MEYTTWAVLKLAFFVWIADAFPKNTQLTDPYKNQYLPELPGYVPVYIKQESPIEEGKSQPIKTKPKNKPQQLKSKESRQYVEKLSDHRPQGSGITPYGENYSGPFGSSNQPGRPGHQGIRPSGQNQQYEHGHRPTGSNHPNGNYEQGHRPSGQNQHGHYEQGNRPGGQNQHGHYEQGNRPGEQNQHGHYEQGNRPGGQNQHGHYEQVHRPDYPRHGQNQGHTPQRPSQGIRPYRKARDLNDYHVHRPHHEHGHEFGSHGPHEHGHNFGHNEHRPNENEYHGGYPNRPNEHHGNYHEEHRPHEHEHEHHNSHHHHQEHRPHEYEHEHHNSNHHQEHRPHEHEHHPHHETVNVIINTKDSKSENKKKS